jgi:uncharacterized membrane protein YccC
LIRLEDVAIGAVVGLAIGVAAWPRGPAAQLRGALAHAIDAGAAYSRAVASNLVQPADGLERARRRAASSARRAEDVFTAYLEEVGDRPTAIDRWSGLLARTHRLWYEASVVGDAGRSGPHGCPHLAASLLDAADRLVSGFRGAAEALRRRARPGPAPALPAAGELGRQALDCAATAAGSADHARLEGIVHLLGQRAWIVELARELDGMRAAVGTLTAAPARG